MFCASAKHPKVGCLHVFVLSVIFCVEVFVAHSYLDEALEIQRQNDPPLWTILSKVPQKKLHGMS